MEFIIIHDSEIIYRGLAAILRDSFACHVTRATEIDHFGDFNPGNNVIILADLNIVATEVDKLRTLISNRKVVGVIALAMADIGKGNISPWDVYTISEKPDLLVSMVEGLLQKRGKDGSVNNTLSNRETEILKLVALGRINKEIADILHISTHTVISHRKNITEKLGIKTIPGLTLYAFLNGIIDGGDI